ncbi:hypothetical protein [Actinophytocola sp.]|uniref:hypothetical protein n=1 Tax=Actinophytocola sp. TaxID=1872138 RepID=UPI002ED569C0
MSPQPQPVHVDQVDLFGDPVPTPIGHAPRESTPPGAGVNDMDLAHTVLADIADEKTAPLHLDDTDQVRRCTERGPAEPVPDKVAVVVCQLITAHYLTTRQQRTCPGHGALIATTRTGRNAVHRWRAYHRPSTWGPAPDPATTT